MRLCILWFEFDEHYLMWIVTFCEFCVNHWWQTSTWIPTRNNRIRLSKSIRSPPPCIWPCNTNQIYWCTFSGLIEISNNGISQCLLVSLTWLDLMQFFISSRFSTHSRPLQEKLAELSMAHKGKFSSQKWRPAWRLTKNRTSWKLTSDCRTLLFVLLYTIHPVSHPLSWLTTDCLSPSLIETCWDN